VNADRGQGGPLRAALIGFGLAGAAFHAPFLDTVDGLELASIVTADPGRRARAAAAYPAARLLASVDDLWSRAGDHDLVVVASPNASHVPLALDALRRGLAVVVDKPVAASAVDAAAIAAAAGRAGRLASVFHNRRWDGDFLTVRDLVETGRLGRVTRFESRFERWRPVADRAVWRESPAPAMAGGQLFDLGSHLVDQAICLFGPPVSIYAEVERRRPGVAVDDDVFVALTHEGGVRSHLWAAAVAGQLGPRLRVLGLGGAYVTWGLDPQEDALRRGERPGGAGWGAVAPERYGTLGAGDALERHPTLPGAYQRYYEGVVAALRDGAAPPVTIDEAVRVVAVLEAARRSAATGQVVELA